MMKRRAASRHGVAMLYIIIAMTVMFGFASLAMDYGRVQLAKSELRTATDQAARYGVKWVSGGTSVALAHCNDAADDNTIDGTPLVLTASDLSVGNWNPQSRVFTPNIKPRNALQITTSRVVPLALGGAIGMDNCTIRATAVAMAVPTSIVALGGFSFKNNTFVASYDSSVNTNPTPGNCNENAALVSNGFIGEQNNGDIRGDCVIGPSGSVDPGFSISGGTTQLTSALTVPAEPAWSPSGNPGGVPQNYVVTSNTTLPGGTYWFTNLMVNRKLNFAGPATFYVNGNIDFNDQVTAYNSIPANLKIYQIGTSRQFGGAGQLVAQVIAPRSAFRTTNNFKFYGSCWFDTITVMNNCEFYYDESIGSVTGISVVK